MKRMLLMGLPFAVLLLTFCQRAWDNPYLEAGYNTPPVARFTVSRAAGTIDTVFYFDASVSEDAEDDAGELRVRWDFDSDGTWDRDWSTAKADSHRYGSSGIKYVTLAVTDNGGLTDTLVRKIDLQNDRPAPAFSLTDNGPRGLTVNADGCSDYETPAELLYVRIDIDSDGSWERDWTLEKTYTFLYDTAGTYTVSLEVKDQAGAIAGTSMVAVSRYGSITDARDGQRYATIAIGSQVWMAENLNIGTRIDGSDEQTNNGVIEKYYNVDSEYIGTVYGALYQWDEAMGYAAVEGGRGICPAGWHVPTDAEWKTLEMHLGMAASDADDTGYRGTDQGTRLSEGGTSGFESLFSGYRFIDGAFYSLGTYAFYWTSSQFDAAKGVYRSLLSKFQSETVFRQYHDKAHGFCIRCVRD